jgi:tetratricopeptide (TPR) repeat protein
MSPRKPKSGPAMSVPQRLKRAEKFYATQRFAAAAREAKGAFDQARPDEDPVLINSAAILALFAYARSGEFERGWQLVEKAAAGASEYLDFCYAACYLAYQRGDYDQAEAWGRSFLERWEAADPTHPRNNTHSKKHEILNTLGCAAKDRGDDRRAMEYLEAARQLAPGYPLPYLNLALLHKRSGSIRAAQEIVETGLSLCGPSEELRMFKDGLLTERTISLCMIVKDEEEMLPAALASARATVDEIIIVDTGSTDRTVALAESAGARVYHHPWEHDFSKARNQSLSYATGDWVLILDADERLTASSAPLVRKLAQTCLQEAISFSVYNVDLDSDHVSFLPSVRMFRNRRGYAYKGIVHNQIDLPRDTPVLRAPVRIDHFGYTPSLADKRGKYERTTGLLQKQLDENPDDAFAHFNMAQIMRGGEAGKARSKEIAFHARRVIELIADHQTEHRHILLMGYHQLATACFHLEDYEAAEKACRDALALKADYLDAQITLGHTLSQRKRYVEAREAFLDFLREREAYDESKETRGFILLNLDSQHQAHYGLGLVEEALGQLPLALEWYRRVLDKKSRYLDTHVRIGRLCYALGRNDEAAAAFEVELAGQPDSFWSHFCLGDLRVHDGRWQEALEHYQSALQIQPQHPSLHVNIAACAYRVGLLDVAHEHLVQADPNVLGDPTALRIQGDVAMHRGDYAAAGVHYERLLAQQPDDAAAWSDLGNVYYRCSEWQKALACYDRALQVSPDLWVARRNRALVYLKRGQTSEARLELAEYVKSQGGDPDTLWLLADLSSQEGHWLEALKLYEQYLTMRPGDRDALFRLSQSYHAMGQQDAAALGYRHLLAMDPGFEPAQKALETLQTA